MRPRLAFRTAPFAAIGLAALTLLAGCTQRTVEFGGSRPQTIVKSAVSLSPSTTEIVASLNYMGILRGRTAYDNFPPSVANVPVVASVKPDFEKIADMKPDLIVFDSSVFNTGDVDKIKGLGIQTFEFNSRTVDDFIKQLYELGSLISAETNASAYVDKIVYEKNAAQTTVAANPPKVAVIMPGDGSEHMVVGAKSFLADVVKIAGGVAVGPDTDNFAPIKVEQLIADNPAIIVVPFTVVKGDEATSRNNALLASKKLTGDPRLANVAAIKNNHIIAIDADILLRQGYRVPDLIRGLAQRIPNLSKP